MAAMNMVFAGGFSGVSFHLRTCPQGVASVLRKKTPIFGSRRSNVDHLTVRKPFPKNPVYASITAQWFNFFSCFLRRSPKMMHSWNEFRSSQNLTASRPVTNYISSVGPGPAISYPSSKEPPGVAWRSGENSIRMYISCVMDGPIENACAVMKKV